MCSWEKIKAHGAEAGRTLGTKDADSVTQSFSNLYRHPRQEKYHSSVSKARWFPSPSTDLRLPFYHLRLPQPSWRLNVFNSQRGPRLTLFAKKSAEIHHGKDLKSGLEYKKHPPLPCPQLSRLCRWGTVPTGLPGAWHWGQLMERG